jgi:hypothetical protein
LQTRVGIAIAILIAIAIAGIVRSGAAMAARLTQ